MSSTKPPTPTRRAGELTARELLRYGWRQLTSMRTALILLLLLALAAVPGSLIPQRGVDALKTTQWQAAHPHLTPTYTRLGLFDVYGSPWFAAIYLLLMVSLVGCIVPRTFVYWRGMRAQPPAAPRNLTRLPDHASYDTDTTPTEVLRTAEAELRRRRYRLLVQDGAVSAEKGYLREAGNLLFHLSVLVVLVGFATGSLFGFKGGVIVVEGGGFSNVPSSYDDTVPGKLFRSSQLEPFHFTLDHFSLDWLLTGARAGMARDFQSELSYTEKPGDPVKKYDLRVNHPLTIGSSELFLIGHGYAPVITVRDGQGKLVSTGPKVFLPQNASFLSFGVVKAQFAEPTQIGLQGEFFPTFSEDSDGNPINVLGKADAPLLSLFVYTGDLNLTNGASQSIYSLDTSKMKQMQNADGTPLRLDLQPGQTVTIPGGLGSVTFGWPDGTRHDDLKQWNKIQISQTPGKRVALAGVLLALLGLLMSLFLRPRRVWVRARAISDEDGGGTLVEVAALDRSGGGDVSEIVEQLVAALQADLGQVRDRAQLEERV